MKKIAIISICKNEEKNLEKWFDFAKEADYICILDTGSTDNTWNILKQKKKEFKDKLIISQSFLGDSNNFNFGEARTLSFKLVPQDTYYCISIDLDEFLEEGWAQSLREYPKDFCVGTISMKLIEDKFEKSYYSCSKILKYDKNITWKYSVSEEPFFEKTPCWAFGIYKCIHLEEIKGIHIKSISKEDYKDRKLLQRRRLKEALDMLQDTSLSDVDKLLISQSGISCFEAFRSGEIPIKDYTPLVRCIEDNLNSDDKVTNFCTIENYNFCLNLLAFFYANLGINEDFILDFCFSQPISVIDFMPFFVEYLHRVFGCNISIKYFKRVLLTYESIGVLNPSVANNLLQSIVFLKKMQSPINFSNLECLTERLENWTAPFKYIAYSHNNS